MRRVVKDDCLTTQIEMRLLRQMGQRRPSRVPRTCVSDSCVHKDRLKAAHAHLFPSPMRYLARNYYTAPSCRSHRGSQVKRSAATMQMDGATRRRCSACRNAVRKSAEDRLHFSLHSGAAAAAPSRCTRRPLAVRGLTMTVTRSVSVVDLFTNHLISTSGPRTSFSPPRSFSTITCLLSASPLCPPQDSSPRACGSSRTLTYLRQPLSAPPPDPRRTKHIHDGRRAQRVDEPV